VTLAAKEAEGRKAVAAMGLDKADAAQLGALSATDLVAKIGGNFGPFIDGKLMTGNPEPSLRRRSRRRTCRLVIGSSNGEELADGPLEPSHGRHDPGGGPQHLCRRSRGRR